MITDLLTIYNDIKNIYELSKDAALVTRDMNIKNGSNISEEIKKYNFMVDLCDKRLETIDIVFRFIMLQYIKNKGNSPIDINEIFDKFKFQITMSPK